MSSKITIIGAGSVGATIAYKLSYEDIASEIVMIDINKDKVEGEVMDIKQGTCFRSPISIIAGDYIMRTPRIPTSSSSHQVSHVSRGRQGLNLHRPMSTSSNLSHRRS